jgi:Type I restriction-modification system methyltransferase subunit
MILANILRDSDYKLGQFKDEKITKLENNIVFKQDKKGSDIAYIECLIRKKQIILTPEEVVRQLYLMVLIDDYHYPNSRIAVEESVSFGREKKRADIVVFDAQQLTVPYIIVELKKPKLKDGKEQLKSYCNATGAPIGVWTNGESISYYNRRDPNYFIDIPSIPKSTQKLTDILTERWTIQTLVDNDKLIKERKSLKDLILEMEDEVLANAGVDVFEELFQLIFTKLFDELSSTRNRSRNLEFRNYGETGAELKEKIQSLFDEAKKCWEGVFDDSAKITLTSSHLEVCVSSLQGIKLFNSNLDVVDEAFEYLINKSSKGDKGQYFTPRYVIDMCVRMLNPQAHEYMIDTAAGSCGFPVHTIFHVWKQQLKERGLPVSHLFTAEKKLPEQEDYVRSKVFAIDFDERAVRVARTLNLIAGDGQTNVMHLNTLDYDRWNDYYNNVEWTDIYGTGWKNIRKLLVNRKSQKVNGETKFDCQDFNFDIIMANPPFAGEIKESRLLAKYELGKNSKGKQQTKVGRDILFIERNLDFLKPGGRMAVVLPQGRFNNSSDKYIREYIADRCRILGVVGLHGNVFKPHTGTKTSVLLLQKWNNDPNLGPLCPRVDDYPIFFATMQEPSKDNSGEKIYVKKQDYPESAQKMQKEQQSAEPIDSYNEDNVDMDQYLLDSHGHLIVKHDLFNHEDLTQDGIAEAFIEFAKKEQLSFF